MKSIYFFFFMLFLCSVIHSQRVYERPTIILVQGFNTGALNSYGTSTIYNKAENIYSLNPASLSNFNSAEFGISFQTESKIDEAYIAGIGYSRIKDATPESFGIIYPYNDFRIGFGFGQTYNGKADIGNIPIATVDQPDGTGETYTPIFETTIRSYTIVFSQSLQNIFEQDDKINVGLKINRNVMHFFEQLNLINSTESKNISGVNENLFCYNFAFGLSYNKNLAKYKKLGIGLYYESAMEFSKNVVYNTSNSGISYPNPSSDRNTYYYYLSASQLIGSVPSKIKFDVDFSISDSWTVLGGTSWIFWNNSNEGLNNQINFSGSAVYAPCEIIGLSAGFYNSTRSYTSDDMDKYFDVDGKINALFITSGINIKYSGFMIDLSLADSHLLSGSWRKQTIFKMGFGYSL